MVIVYDSMTGNTRRFSKRVVEGTDIRIFDLRKDDIPLLEDFLLITHTIGKGNVPDTTLKFLEEHKRRLQGVCSSGSINWGDNFGKAGKIVSYEYNVPLIGVFNKSGSLKDVEDARRFLV